MKRFLCDAMLAGLARWLRAAGYDTQLSDGRASDRSVLHCAISEERCLLTRDRKLLEFRNAPGRVMWLAGNAMDEWIKALNREFRIDWQSAAFTRCLVCNSLLGDAPVEKRAEVPEDVRVSGGAIRYCPACRKLYWEGGHVRRMRAQLAVWQELR